MTGPKYTISNLDPSKLAKFKQSVVSGQVSPQDILDILSEIEYVHTQFNALEKKSLFAEWTCHQIASIGYDDIPNVNRMCSLAEEVEYASEHAITIDITRMHNLLAQLLQQVDTAGVVSKGDEVVLNIRRYLFDADLIE